MIRLAWSRIRVVSQPARLAVGSSVAVLVIWVVACLVGLLARWPFQAVEQSVVQSAELELVVLRVLRRAVLPAMQQGKRCVQIKMTMTKIMNASSCCALILIRATQ